LPNFLCPSANSSNTLTSTAFQKMAVNVPRPESSSYSSVKEPRRLEQRPRSRSPADPMGIAGQLSKLSIERERWWR